MPKEYLLNVLLFIGMIVPLVLVAMVWTDTLNTFLRMVML